MKKFFFLFLFAFTLLSYSSYAGDSLWVSGSNIKMTRGIPSHAFFGTHGMSVGFDNNFVKLYYGDINKPVYAQRYASIAYPTHTSLRNLMDKINAMIDTCQAGIAGTASALNQLTQVSKLASIYTSDSTLVTVLHKLAASDSGYSKTTDSTLFGTTPTAISNYPCYVDHIEIGVPGANTTYVYLYDNSTLLCTPIRGDLSGPHTIKVRATTSLKWAIKGSSTAPKVTVFWKRLAQ